MHKDNKDRSEGGWSELKGKAKKQWDKFNNKPLDDVDVTRNGLDEDTYDQKKIKKDRADKHLQNVQNMLQGMENNHKKNLK